MHEGPIAQGILDAALEILPSGHRLRQVNLAVGVLAGVEGECLRLYFDELVRRTEAEGAVIAIRRVLARLVCPRCGAMAGYDGAGELALRCSRCGGPNRLIGGRELRLESIEVDGDEAPGADADDPGRQ
jgi:Zn finger protein HypA/HybF involved in hydrogenase expression